MLSRSLAAFAAIAVALGLFCLPPAFAQATTTLGIGVGYSTFLADGSQREGKELAVFGEFEYGIDWGFFEPLAEVDGGVWDEAEQEFGEWFPVWYAAIGYAFATEDDPIHGGYIMALRRLGHSDAFWGIGPQIEFWDRRLTRDPGEPPPAEHDLDGDGFDDRGRVAAFGARFVLELPGEFGDRPLRLAVSMVTDGGRERVEVSLVGTS